MSWFQAVVGSGSIMGKNRMNSLLPSRGSMGRVGPGWAVLQLLGVLAVGSWGVGCGVDWKGQLGLPGSPADTPPETFPLPHPTPLLIHFPLPPHPHTDWDGAPTQNKRPDRGWGETGE